MLAAGRSTEDLRTWWAAEDEAWPASHVVLLFDRCAAEARGGQSDRPAFGAHQSYTMAEFFLS
jgi:hypothetical protein